jgi:hypothetical protein
MHPRPVLEAFDRWLSSHELRLDAIVIGGAALALMGVTDRQTRDVDVLNPELSNSVLTASKSFAVHLRSQGTFLQDDWLNNGPIQLAEMLPEGWRNRVHSVFSGDSVRLFVLGRDDLLKTKLFALCDRGTDLADCVALSPTAAELRLAQPWVEAQDMNPLWPMHVEATFNDLSKRLGHAI